jgi:hypothetical protein
MNKYNYNNKNLYNTYNTYNTFKNYNNGVRGVIAPYPLSDLQNKMIKEQSYSYVLQPTCDGYYNLNGSCSS